MKKIRDIIVIGDTHFCGSTAVFPEQFDINDGQTVVASNTQRILWTYWQEFWEWAFGLIGKEPFILVHNGDLVDNRHHHTLQLASGSEAIQLRVAEYCLKEYIDKAEMYFQIRGTPAHSGQLAEMEEMFAQKMGAVPDENGDYARYQLFIETSKDLIHFAHHIPHTTATAYKSSPLMRLIGETFAYCGQSGLRPPSILVRSHAHDYAEVKVAGCRAVVCPCWQSKTEYIWKRNTTSDAVIGGLVIREGDYGTHIREKTFTLPRPKIVRL